MCAVLVRQVVQMEALVCSTKLQRITSPVSVLRTILDSPVTLVCVYNYVYTI